MSNKVVLHCQDKEITITKKDDRLDFLVDYGSIETFDVLSLTKEEASLFASTIRIMLGQEQVATPKEKLERA